MQSQCYKGLMKIPKRHSHGGALVCPFCSASIRLEDQRIPRMCHHCHRNLYRPGDRFLVYLRQSYWMRFLLGLIASIWIVQIGIWAWSSKAFDIFLLLLLGIGVFVYYLPKKQ